MKASLSLNFIGVAGVLVALAACNQQGAGARAVSAASAPTQNSTPDVTVPATPVRAAASDGSTIEPAAGPRAARVIFRSTTDSQPAAGSFNTGPAAGTPANPGFGHAAQRMFNPDSSLLAASPSATNWPKWIERVEIGLSGFDTSNQNAKACARFAAANEDGNECSFTNPPGAALKDCGANVGLFRVSEYDCAAGGVIAGNGGPNDSVYIRVTFRRVNPVTGVVYLAPHENILAVLEYSASTLRPAPALPTNCFSGGQFSPGDEQCSDMVWQAYLKHSAYEIVQPYLMLVPPAFTSVLGNPNLSGGTAVGSRQFYLPIAADSALNVLQISRFHGPALSTPNFKEHCAPGVGRTLGLSPHCVGMIFNALTLYRI